MTDDDRSPGPLAPLKAVGRALGRSLQLLDAGIRRFEWIVLSWGVLIMAANSIANVIGRFVFNQSLYFSMELNQFLMVLITFMGLGYACAPATIRMSAIYDQLPDAGRKVLMIIIAAVTSVIMFVLAYYAFSYVHRIWELQKTTPSLRLPLWITYVWVPLGFLITGIQYALTVFQNLRSPEVYVSYEKIDSYEESAEDAVM
ncbi:MAG: TRAP transporter small permease [Halofilum sp. (in: g-proteobacteria)]|nr:TRAP transporter small permease [Halofilum sp. (in: g-proteobacteria)]